MEHLEESGSAEHGRQKVGDHVLGGRRRRKSRREEERREEGRERVFRRLPGQSDDVDDERLREASPKPFFLLLPSLLSPLRSSTGSCRPFHDRKRARNAPRRLPRRAPFSVFFRRRFAAAAKSRQAPESKVGAAGRAAARGVEGLGGPSREALGCSAARARARSFGRWAARRAERASAEGEEEEGGEERRTAGSFSFPSSSSISPPSMLELLPSRAASASLLLLLLLSALLLK